MRQFANLFLILFLADGAVSTLDELLAAVSGMHLLHQVRNLGAFPVLFLSVPLFVAMGIDRRIPKRVFLPMALYALWGAVIFWPMPLFIPEGMFGILMSLGQLGIGLAGLHAVRKRSGHDFLMTPSMFSEDWFSWKNTLGFFSMTALLVPLTLLVIGTWSLATLVEVKTSGFMKIRASGLYMNEKIYSKGGKTLRLVPMIHIGRTDYYDEVGGSMTNGKTIILAEGVSDREGLLKAKLSYDKIGELLGLTSQTHMRMDGTHVTSDFIPQSTSPDVTGDEPHIVSADLDLSQFSPTTIEFLGVLTSAFFNGQSLSDGYAQYTAWIYAQGNDQQTLDTITHDIFTQRNEAVFAMLSKALPHYDTLIIPWGALHMAEIEKEAQRLGFFMLGEKERLSVDFGEALEHLNQVRGGETRR
jgi:hypothetical protein